MPFSYENKIDANNQYNLSKRISIQNKNEDMNTITESPNLIESNNPYNDIFKSNSHEIIRFNTMGNNNINTIKKINKEPNLQIKNEKIIKSDKIFQANNKEIYFSKRK